MSREVPNDPEARRILRERDDAGMIGREDMWPAWPALCLKRRLKDSKDWEFGVAMARRKSPTGDVVEPRVMVIHNPVRLDEDKIEPRWYDNAAAAVADGWMVD